MKKSEKLKKKFHYFDNWNVTGFGWTPEKPGWKLEFKVATRHRGGDGRNMYLWIGNDGNNLF